MRTPGALHYLDHLGNPFLFLEEREVFVRKGERLEVQNILPKVVMVLEGRLRHQFEGDEVGELSPGSVLVKLQRGCHWYHGPLQEPSGTIKVLRLTFPWNFALLDAELPDGLLGFGAHLAERLPLSGILTVPPNQTWGAHLNACQTALHARDAERRWRAHASLRLALLELLAHQTTDSSQQPDPLLSRVEHFLEDNLHRPLRLAEVAKAVDYSEEHLARSYRARSGETVFERLRHLRMERACYFLLCTDLSITKIAQRVGFTTLAHFSRAFQQTKQCSPNQYRARITAG